MWKLWQWAMSMALPLVEMVMEGGGEEHCRWREKREQGRSEHESTWYVSQGLALGFLSSLVLYHSSRSTVFNTYLLSANY